MAISTISITLSCNHWKGKNRASTILVKVSAKENVFNISLALSKPNMPRTHAIASLIISRGPKISELKNPVMAPLMPPMIPSFSNPSIAPLTVSHIVIIMSRGANILLTIPATLPIIAPNDFM